MVLTRRVRHYPHRNRVHRVVAWRNGKRTVAWLDDPGGTGWEAVKTARACPQCAARLLQESGGSGVASPPGKTNPVDAGPTWAARPGPAMPPSPCHGGAVALATTASGHPRA